MKRLLSTLLLLTLTTTALFAQQTPPTNPAIVPAHRLGLNWWKVRLAEKEAQAKQQHDTVLIGDSITHNWDVVAPDLQTHYFGKPLNLGFSGDRTQEVLWRINRIDWSVVAPKRIMLMIGTNNTGHNIHAKPEDTFAGIQAIVTTLQEKCPQATITVLSIFPRGQNGSDPKRRINDIINQSIPTLANDTTVRHVDISACYLAEDGHTLRRDLLPDLLHPNKEGHRLWGEAVAKEFMGTPAE
ncbi:MAG: acetylglucosamine-6-sulfatase [Kiritimatiellae bacterium]|nr:acetylglucosamine-6-sulfatase [Kiritimatiellia bacterium]MBR5587900.1 acetylglucosamine-6-sulfatase [Kiritimatiellia bacterium]